MKEPMSALLDRFGRFHNYLRISVTDRCNFRCGYCMPPEGVEWKPRDEVLTLEEIERLSALFVRLGVSKIRLTGGEPTIRKNIEHLMASLKALDGMEQLLMTTNGTTLATHAHRYKAAGLDGLNISLDSLDPQKFREITLRDEFARVFAGIHTAIELGFSSIKINVVVLSGVNDDEIVDFVRLTEDLPIQVRFIEFMPFAGNDWKVHSVFTYKQMCEKIEREFLLLPIETEKTAVGKDFSIPGHKGSVGFVTSMTESFCDGCNRIRLTAEGSFKSCLFSAAEVSLRDPMRQGAAEEELIRLISENLQKKWKGHPDLQLLPLLPNRSMVAIGG